MFQAGYKHDLLSLSSISNPFSHVSLLQLWFSLVFPKLK